MIYSTLSVWILWGIGAVLFVLGAWCFYCRRFWALTFVVPLFLAVCALSGYGASRALDTPAVFVLTLLGEGLVVLPLGLFLVDAWKGLWAFDMTYVMVLCWLLAPLLLLFLGFCGFALLAGCGPCHLA